MFKLPMQENQENYVEINDFNQNVVAAMLRFMYTGEHRWSSELSEDLLRAADKYGMERLKIICGACLVNNLSAKTAVNYLKLGELYDMKDLKTRSENLLKEHGQKMFKNIKSEKLVKIYETLMETGDI